MATYKTNSPETLAALDAQYAAINALREKAKAFAERFGANKDYVVRNSITNAYAIAGFTFTPQKDTTVWTKPDRAAMGIQRPRAKVTGLGEEERAAWKTLRDEWDKHFPAEPISWVPVLASVGLTPGDLFFSGYFQLFEHAGWVYLSTGAKPRANHLVEILASEFDAAAAAMGAVKKKEAA